MRLWHSLVTAIPCPRQIVDSGPPPHRPGSSTAFLCHLYSRITRLGIRRRDAQEASVTSRQTSAVQEAHQVVPPGSAPYHLWWNNCLSVVDFPTKPPSTNRTSAILCPPTPATLDPGHPRLYVLTCLHTLRHSTSQKTSLDYTSRPETIYGQKISLRSITNAQVQPTESPELAGLGPGNNTLTLHAHLRGGQRPFCPLFILQTPKYRLDSKPTRQTHVPNLYASALPGINRQ